MSKENKGSAQAGGVPETTWINNLNFNQFRQQKKMIELYLSKNNNHSSEAYGKYYPRVSYKETLDIHLMAKHMAEHNTQSGGGDDQGGGNSSITPGEGDWLRENLNHRDSETQRILCRDSDKTLWLRASVVKLSSSPNKTINH